MKQEGILILSDIHFGKHASSADFALPGATTHQVEGATPMKQSLIDRVNALDFKISVILVSGDLTSVASPAEFNGCVNCVFEIADAIDVDRTKVLFTFGNHDVDWRICELAKATNTHAEDGLYDHIAIRSGTIFAKNDGFNEHGPVPGSGLFIRDDLIVFVVNSGVFCTRDQNYPHGKLGEAQFQWLKAQLERPLPEHWRVLMVHHHPFNYPYRTLIEDASCLEEGADLVELAGKNRIHLICHGHRHEPKIFTTMSTGWHAPMTFFCAGSVAVTSAQRNNGEIPNFFHVAKLNRLLKSGAAFGEIRSFEYRSDKGWMEAQMADGSPLDAIQHFGIAADATELRQEVENLVTSVEKIVGERWFPEFHSLPLALQCIRLNELNRLIEETVAQRQLRMVARYPDRPLML